ncbi:MAG TPA: UDP-N-acetylmuramate--L-alanine ligase [Nitrospina sp.]|jgi:UDP-N-acetylmuramate--alanine ligase|nr:UDP-N-acetylmuramate--L-alanine ligase [Nitrospinaceae bacterium]HBP10417.1 UDP-N-acetylmuramate--L-alanine ligase [Nitrospina sp.]|tara:strand:- start:3604 stop:4980 length:1377 start_codon:yes stop_codon:yes gene_type:complete
MFLGKIQRIHFIGIGGSGMSGIAEVLINQDYEVSGSDPSSNRVTDHLKTLGADIRHNHSAENVSGKHVVVVSSAISDDNVEVQAAREQSIPVIPRAEMLAELMRMKYGIAIAGTHGKTTTTSLVATVLAAGSLDPTVVIGGRIKNMGGHAKLGQSQYLIAEADESDGSFLKLSPTLAVVTTLDEEHMDFYLTMENMKSTFLQFLNRIPFYGAAILCMDDANLQSLLPRIEKRTITYGLKSQADYTARNISVEGLKTYFTVYHHGKKLGKILSGALGRHNVCNTLAAVAVGMELNMDFPTIAESLKTFTGVQRRFEILKQSESLIIVDDYGHHPVEIQATLSTAKEVWPDRRLVIVFQPHRYSRTKHLMESFFSSFNDADQLLLLDIYSAGEEAEEGIHSQRIAEGVKEFGHKNVEYIGSTQSVIPHLQKILKPGDIVMTLGAGNIGELSHRLASRFND